MTKEEAILWLNEEIRTWENECQSKHPIKEALYEACKALERELNAWSLDDAREDFMYDVYNILDFLPTNDEANQIIDSFDRVTKGIKQEPRWIPITERLPKENICNDGYHEPSERVLAYMKSGEMHVARYWSRYDYRWLGIISPTTDEVIAWMPLPQPYKAEGEGKE